MALNNYANLKQAIERFSHRDDISNVVDDFIDLAENKIDHELELRTNEVRSTNTASTSSRFLSLPDSFLEMRRMSLINGSLNFEISFQAPEQMRIKNESGRPTYYTVTSQIEFDRTPDSAYTVEMSYYVRLTPLDDTNTTNDVLTNHPNLYLYGSLAELYKWARDEETSLFYESLFDKEMIKANEQENRGRFGPSMAMKYQGATP